MPLSSRPGGMTISRCWCERFRCWWFEADAWRDPAAQWAFLAHGPLPGPEHRITREEIRARYGS
jgi:hypothetical protein